jgi:protein-tyrosine-phosphatase
MAMTGQPPAKSFSILYVCTGNICRSPLAERLTWLRLAQAVGAQAAGYKASSQGTGGLVGRPMDAAAATQLRRLGGDPGGFAARALTVPELQGADLILTATRGHRSRVLEEEPRALRRTFTIREFADLVDGATGRSPAELIAGAASRRADSRVRNYDIADPIGAPEALHAQVADVIDTSVTVLVRALAATITDAR